MDFNISYCEVEDLKYLLALSYIKGLGSLRCNALLNKFKEPMKCFLFYTEQNLFNESHTLLNKAEKEIEMLQKQHISTIPITSDSYPAILKECSDPPLILFVKSKVNKLQDLLSKDSLSIVGTRKASMYGLSQTEKLISELQNLDILITSGLALGIDTKAHKASIKYNIPTVAVLANGLDSIYPIQNKDLANEIIENGGAIISEMNIGTKIRPGLFPKRNRIIAGISKATIVVEAAIKGGALITAKIANSYDRAVFAIPGKNDMYYSKGCNLLIKEQLALLLENANDITTELGWESHNLSLFDSTNSTLPENTLTLPEKVLRIIKRESPASIEILCKETETGLPEMVALLISMEISGLIKNTPGNLYLSLH